MEKGRPETPHRPPIATVGETLAWVVGREVFPEWQIESLQMKWNQSRRPGKKMLLLSSATNSWTEEPSRWGEGSRTFAQQLPQDVVVVLQPWDLSTSVTEAISIFLY